MELAIAYYSLALSYTPPYERDLKATILSNRSLMYKKTGKDEEALRDALQCVQNNPNWAKVTKSQDSLFYSIWQAVAHRMSQGKTHAIFFHLCKISGLSRSQKL